MTIPVLVIGAAQSGAGKTTATLALILGLRGRGLRVQPFKVGPDYLDTSLLTWAAGRAARNLDGWMLPEPHLLELFHRACRGADVAVVEGVMGLFDGRAGATDEASTAAVARWLGAPVLLVLDVQRSARTVGAVALGLRTADPRVDVAGVVLNRVASERHLASCRSGLDALAVRCLGHLDRDPDMAVGQRYLGLVSPADSPPSPRVRRRLAIAAGTLELDAILRLARPARTAAAPALFPPRPVPTATRIAVARDRAFNFYYQDSLDLLTAWGAELVPFSPLADDALPDGVDAVYLGGGYPELFAAELTANAGMRRSLRRSPAVVYAECGGAMYAAAGIEDADGRRHPMAGLWPAWMSLRRRRLSLGYRTIRSRPPNLLAGWELPAHEFHYSRVVPGRRRTDPAWSVLDDGQRAEGCASPRLTASYMHVHLGSRPGLARAFVAACRRRP